MADLIKSARQALETSYQYDRDNRQEAMADLRFCAGFHWSDKDRADRKGRPMITINRSQQFLRQVSNPIRQNMPILKVETDGQDSNADPELINGLLRRIQYNSSAAHKYAQAVEHAVACGIGWFRVATQYYDEESFNQDICIERIFNPLTVYPDPAALEPDRSDMTWCMVSEPIPIEAFKVKYPKAAVTGLDPPKNQGTSTEIAWGSGEWVRVAEYWRRKETADEILLIALPTGEQFTRRKSELSKDQIEFLTANSLVANSRAAKSYKTVMTLVSGVEELEDEVEFPCKFIPLIPVIGAEIPLDKGTYRHGLIRFQREPQQLQNYFLSVATEFLGQQPKSPYLVTTKMIQKFKGLWDNANRDATPYLPYDPDPSAPGSKPERMQPPPLPAALVQMSQLMADAQKDTTSIYDAALGAKSNETSGVAIATRQEQGTQATFHYVDNLEHSLEHLGRILLNMIPSVYDTERTMMLQTDDDQEKKVTINQEVMRYGDEAYRLNDVTKAKYQGVRVVLGPSYASRRQEAVQLLMQLVQALPQVGMVAGDLIAKNLDFEGSEQLAERLRATLPPQILQLENPEMAEAQQPPPDPMQDAQMQSALQMMETELSSANAKAEQEQAKAAQEAAKVEGVQLDNALKVKRLTEPPPQRSPLGRDVGNQARQ
jgi:hypothetical protein